MFKKICEMVERNLFRVTQKSTKDFSPLTETEIKRMFNAKSNTAQTFKNVRAYAMEL